MEFEMITIKKFIGCDVDNTPLFEDNEVEVIKGTEDYSRAIADNLADDAALICKKEENELLDLGNHGSGFSQSVDKKVFGLKITAIFVPSWQSRRFADGGSPTNYPYRGGLGNAWLIYPSGRGARTAIIESSQVVWAEGFGAVGGGLDPAPGCTLKLELIVRKEN
jgi:hypothetical protein